MPALERTYEIHEVAELTGPGRREAPGVGAALRGGAAPRRPPNGYRAYTADQVALLRAYARLIAAGERIGDLAGRRARGSPGPGAGARARRSPQAALLDAVAAFDRERLEGLVAQQLALRGLRAFAQEVVLPLAQSVGDLWALGRIPIAAEHLASEVVLHALKGGLRLSRGTGPLLVCGCLVGRATRVGLSRDTRGGPGRRWRIHYLGADLPVDAVVEAAWKLVAEGRGVQRQRSLHRARQPSGARAFAGLPPRTMAVIGGGGADPLSAMLRGCWGPGAARRLRSLRAS